MHPVVGMTGSSPEQCAERTSHREARETPDDLAPHLRIPRSTAAPTPALATDRSAEDKGPMKATAAGTNQKTGNNPSMRPNAHVGHDIDALTLPRRLASKALAAVSPPARSTAMS